MAKPRIQTRVDENVKDRIEEYADRYDMSKSEAMRHLLTRGLDYEDGNLVVPDERQPALPDGGVKQLAENQERQQRSQQYQGAGLAFGIVYLALLTTGVLPDLVAAVFGAAIVGVLSYSMYVARRGDDVEVAGWEADDYESTWTADKNE
jgi:hypothetical protein